LKAGYIESWGRGTNKIIDSCIEAGLPEPLIEEEQGGFSITFLKEKYTYQFITGQNLEKRQIKAMLYIKEHGSINNTEYQELANISKRTATRDLQEMMERRLLRKIGTTGKGTSYIFETLR